MAVKKVDSIFMRKIAPFIALIFALKSFAANQPQLEHLLPVGQGISSPTFHTGLIFGSGHVSQNPSGLNYQNGFYVSAFRDSGNNGREDVTGKGGTLSGGNGKFGLGLGYYSKECTNCEEDFYFGGAVLLENFSALGVKVEDGDPSFGLIFNPDGKYRVGAVFSQVGESNRYGVGLSVVDKDYTFSADASKRDTDDEILMTAGVMIRMQLLQASLNYESILEGEGDEDVWFAVGIFLFKDAYFSYRSDFINDNQLVFTYAF